MMLVLPTTYAQTTPLSSISPAVGLTTGGNTVTITGHNFVPSPDYTDATGAQYAQLEYLTFTGTQYINTGVKNNGLIDAEVDFKYASSSGSGYLLGVVQTAPGSWENAFMYYQGGYLYNLTGPNLWHHGNTTDISTPDANRHIFSKKGNTACLDATCITSNVGTMALVGTYDIYVGALNFRGTFTYNQPLKGNIYSIKFWRNNVLVRNFVPAFNIATGKKGLFDIVDNKFYPSNSGAFDNAYSITFDGRAAADIVIVNNNITCTVPAHAEGTVDVIVNNSIESKTLTQSYTYHKICGGSGTQADPYQICNLTALLYLSEHSAYWGADVYFIQTADIDAYETSTWNGGKGFSPIGNSSTKFAGTYNGKGHTISNLYINRPEQNNIGLFGVTYNNAVIDSIAMVNANIIGNQNVGGLVGTNSSASISNSYTTGYVVGIKHVGGLAGGNTSASITNSYSTSKVSGAIWIGGLVGVNTDGTITNSYSIGTLSVSSGGTSGGLIGYHNSGTLSNNYYDSEISGQQYALGGSGTAGAADKTHPDAQPRTTAEMWQPTTFTSWNFTNIWLIREGKSYPYFKWQSAPVYVNHCNIKELSIGLLNPADSVVIYNSNNVRIKGLSLVAAVSNLLIDLDLTLGDTIYIVTYEAGKAPSYPVRAIAKAKSVLSVSDITPNLGAIAGGNTVTITGHNFLPISTYYVQGNNHYAPMEYLNFTGAQYINTGIVPSNGAVEVEVDFAYTASGNHDIFGAENSNQTFFWLSSYRGFVFSAAQPTELILSAYDTKRHLFSYKGSSTITWDGIVKTSTHIASKPPTIPIYLGGINENNEFKYSFIGKVYAFKLWQSGKLVADYVPVYDIATGKGGMWDLVTQKFLGSNSATPFAKNMPVVTFDGTAATNVVVINNDTITCTVPAHAVGTVDVVVVNNLAERDTLKKSYTYLPDTITVTPRNTFKVYGGADPAIPYTLTDNGGHAMTGVTRGTFGRTAGDSVGEYRLTFNPADWKFANHLFRFDTTGVKFTIVPDTLTITARDTFKVYDGTSATDPLLPYSITSGVLHGADTLRGALAREAGDTVRVEGYAIEIGTLSAGDNYDIHFVGKTFTIVPDTITVKARDTFKVYGDADPAIPYTLTDNGGHDMTGVTCGTFGRTAGDSVGEYRLTFDPADWKFANHLFRFDTTGVKFTIVPDTLTITARDTFKVYDGTSATDPLLPYSITSGVLHGADTLRGALAREAGDTVRVGGYAIEIGTLSAGDNYDIHFVGKTFTIVPDTITVKARDTFKVYGAANPAIPYTLTDNGGHDMTGVTCGTFGRTAGDNVGEYRLTFTPADWTFANHLFRFDTTGVKFTIVPDTITVKARDTSKNHGAADPVIPYTAIDKGGHAVALTGSLAREAGEDAGKYAITIGNLAAPDANHVVRLDTAKATFTIRKIIKIVVPKPKSDNTESWVDTVMGARYDAALARWVIHCGYTDALTVKVTLADTAAKVYYQGIAAPNQMFTVNVSDVGVDEFEYMVVAENGVNTDTVAFELERQFVFDQVVRQRWNNVLVVNNNPQNNGGYNFASYLWYINGEELGTEQYYSVSNTRDQMLDLTAQYAVTMTTVEGKTLRTCTDTISIEPIETKNLRVYPNPVTEGKLNIEGELLQAGNEIMLYTMTGNLVGTYFATQGITRLSLPPLPMGVYVMRVQNKNIKIIIQ
ncbi:hypothetical protein AGMMS4956_12790 [Bacteroidia bacterium]|nr:hypothetical protein AGMMS4956_12790 [Bacteroidia bacterium]